MAELSRDLRRLDPQTAWLLVSLAGGEARANWERVADGLRRALTLRLFASDRLPTERDLASAFGVSRITVRQALEVLRNEGLVRSLRGRHGGTFQVTPAAPMAPDLARMVGEAAADMADILDFRLVVEPVAVRLAAEAHRPEFIDQLEAIVERMEADENADSFRRTDSAFHLAIAEASGNRRLLAAITLTRADLLHWRDLLPMRNYVTENVADHREITQAIASRNGEAAARAMARHLETTKEAFTAEAIALFEATSRPIAEPDASVARLVDGTSPSLLDDERRATT